MGYYDTLTVNQQAALKQLPQFYNLTPEEINNVFAKFDDLEIVEATQHKQNITYQGRISVAKCKEEGKLCSPLPVEDVKIDRGIYFSKNTSGFVSFDTISLGVVYFRFSLPSRCYCLMKELLIKKVVSEHKFPIYLERSYDYVHFR